MSKITIHRLLNANFAGGDYIAFGRYKCYNKKL